MTSDTKSALNRNISQKQLIRIVMSILIVAVSFAYLKYAWHNKLNKAIEESKLLIETSVVLISAADVQSLNGNSSDLAAAKYQEIKQNITRMAHIDKDIRFVYLLRQENDNVIFLVDSEPVVSSGYSGPGDIYNGASEEIKIATREKRTVIVKNNIDRWGSWVTFLAPIKDVTTDEVVALCAIDYPIEKWKSTLIYSMIPDGVIFLCVLILFFAFLRIFEQNVLLKKHTQELKTDEALFRNVFDDAPIGIGILTDDSLALSVKYGGLNSEFEKILGRSSEEIAKTRWRGITHPDDVEHDLQLFRSFVKGEIDKYTNEKRYLRPNGSAVCTRIHVSPLSNFSRQSAFLVIAEDISERRKMEQALKESERSKAVLLSHLPGMAFRRRCDEQWNLEFISEGCKTLIGVDAADLIYPSADSYILLVAPEYRSHLLMTWTEAKLKGRNYRIEYELVASNGERKWLLELGQCIYDAENVPEAIEGIAIDMTESKLRESQISYLREHDFLTGLYNRSQFEDEMKKLDQPENLPLSVVTCDINGLRIINDAFGYSKGDQVICDVAQIIKNFSQSSYVLGRTGGDDFSILLPCTGKAEAEKWANDVTFAVESFYRNENIFSGDIILSVGFCTKEHVDQKIEHIVGVATTNLNHRKLLNRRSSHSAILSSIMATLYARSQETEEHGRRLAWLAEMMGSELGLSGTELDDIEVLAMIHDIGKIGIDDRILNKPGFLEPEEWEQMKQHSEIGYKLALSASDLGHIAEYILHHHERWDGSGYPHGLKKEEIPLASRVIAIADAYDAMTSNRVYHKAISHKAALEEIKRCAGTQFDPDIVELFVRLMNNQENPLTG